MERDRLCRLLPKDKCLTQPAKVKCVGFISENGDFSYQLVLREKPVNAVLYLSIRQTEDAEKFLEDEKQRGIRHCSMQGYQPLVLLESIGGDLFMEGEAMERILELVEHRFVDVVVLSHVNNLFQFLNHAEKILDALYSHGVTVDCVGCGAFGRGVFESYQRKSWRQEREFRVKLMGLVLSRKKMERAGDGIC